MGVERIDYTSEDDYQRAMCDEAEYYQRQQHEHNEQTQQAYEQYIKEEYEKEVKKKKVT